MSSRKSGAYKHPTQHLVDLDTRRAEMLEQAPVQAAELHVDERDIIEAMVQVDSLARAKGDPVRGQMITELELEHIRQDQDRDAYAEIEKGYKEIVSEFLAAGPDYKPVMDEAKCNCMH